MVKQKVTQLMRTSVFRVEHPGEPKAYIVELRDIYSYRTLGFESFCRVWLASEGEQKAMEIPLEAYPKNLSKKRLAQHIVCGLVAITQWRPTHED